MVVVGWWWCGHNHVFDVCWHVAFSEFMRGSFRTIVERSKAGIETGIIGACRNRGVKPCLTMTEFRLALRNSLSGDSNPLGQVHGTWKYRLICYWS